MLSLNRIERICLSEFGQFIRRHRRYFITFLAIYLYSLFAWNRLRLLRAGHCLAQHIDDVLDGDRLVDIPPLEYVDDLIRQIETDTYDLNASIPTLACYVFQQADAPLRAELLALFRALRVDRERLETRRVFSKSQLEEQHRNTFLHSMNASLMMVGSTLRASDAPEMVGALSWVSPMRDLRDDLTRGLVNIPLEVIEQARREGVESLDYDLLVTTPALKMWMREEFTTGQQHLRALPQRLWSHFPKRGVLEIWAFYFEISRYAARYRRRQRGLFTGA